MMKFIMCCHVLLMAATAFTQENSQYLLATTNSDVEKTEDTANVHSGIPWNDTMHPDHVTVAVHQKNSNNLASIDLGSKNQGLLLNRLTPEEIEFLEMSLGVNEEGLMIYNIQESRVQTWNGVKWICFNGSNTAQKTDCIHKREVQNLKSAELNGNMLTIAIDKGNAVSVDLSPVLSSYDERIRRLEEMLLNTSTLNNAESPIRKEASLFQNNPNPADGVSSIGYFIPREVNTAGLTISNSMGQVVSKNELLERGTNGQISLGTDQLETGVYYYTLSIDEEVVDSKKMIVK